MRNFGMKLILGVLLCAAVAPAAALAQGFEANRDEGLKALAQGDYARAESLLAAALGDAASFPPTDARLVPVLEGLGTAYLRQQKYAEAEAPLQRALAVRGRHSGHENLDVTPALYDLALLYAKQKKFTEAEPLALRALAITEKAAGKEHPSHARSLNSLAAVYTEQGRFDEAEPLLTKSLQVQEAAFGPEHEEIAPTLDLYAALLRKMSREEEAVQAEARAAAIRAR